MVCDKCVDSYIQDETGWKHTPCADGCEQDDELEKNDSIELSDLEAGSGCPICGSDMGIRITSRETKNDEIILYKGECYHCRNQITIWND